MFENLEVRKQVEGESLAFLWLENLGRSLQQSCLNQLTQIHRHVQRYLAYYELVRYFRPWYD